MINFLGLRLKFNKTGVPIILQTGFRIFFLGAAFYAVISMAIWLLFYVAGGNIFVAMPLTVWHGHEMVFGFTMAVIAGFLLTAVINWTGLPTLSGIPLLILFLFWAAARVLAFMPASFPQWPMALCDSVFLILLIIGIVRPILAAKQGRQLTIVIILIIFFLSNLVFYAALFHADLQIQRKTLRFVVYMIISLILIIARRVIPFFITAGVGYSFNPRNSAVLDAASMALMKIFVIIDIFLPSRIAVIILSALLAAIHLWRLAGWYTHGIWKKPLLWILFAGYLFLIAGFILKLFSVLFLRPDDAALHAFTAGGIGIFTLGMMARVSWGHTGRKISEAPRGLPLMFIPLMTGALIRVFLPLLDESRYVLWIGISQILWMAAFSLYLFLYFPVLVSPRTDDKPG